MDTSQQNCWKKPDTITHGTLQGESSNIASHFTLAPLTLRIDTDSRGLTFQLALYAFLWSQ